MGWVPLLEHVIGGTRYALSSSNCCPTCCCGSAFLTAFQPIDNVSRLNDKKRNVMYCNEKMKLNKFVDVRIPTPAAYMARYGQGNPSAGTFSGEEDTIPFAQSKIDAIAQIDDEFKEFIPSSE